MKARTDLDGDTCERMLAGAIPPDDAPPGYADVARVLQTVSAPASDTSQAREAWAVTVARQVIDEQVTEAPTGRSSMRSKYRRAKVVSVVTLGTLVGTSGMAFAGVLPAPAQDAVAAVFDRIGITVPSGDPGIGSTVSSVATTTTSTGVEKGQEISTIASGGKSQAGLHGRPADPGNPPNRGGHGHAGEHGNAGGASSGASDHGNSTASTHSGGASSAGAGHASEHVPHP